MQRYFFSNHLKTIDDQNCFKAFYGCIELVLSREQKIKMR